MIKDWGEKRIVTCYLMGELCF